MSNKWFSDMLPAITNASASLNNGQSKVDPNNLINRVATPIIGAGVDLASAIPGNLKDPKDQTPGEKRGLQMVQDILLGGGANPEMGAVAGNEGFIANQALDASKAGVKKVAQGIEDTAIPAYRASPIGNEAGFLGTKAAPKLSSGTKLVRDMRTTVNPTFKAIKPTEANPNQFALEGYDGSGIPVNKPVGELPPIEPSITKPVTPELAPLSARQQLLNKTAGIDRYQGPTQSSQDFTKNVLTREVKGNTWDEKFANLEPAKQAVWQRIVNRVKADPTPIDISTDIAPRIKGYLDNDVANNLISQGDADTALGALKTQLTTLANKEMQEAPVEGATTVPMNTGLSKLQVLQSKVGANKLADNAYDAFGKLKETLNPQQRINVAVARGLKDSIGTVSPETSLDNKIYGALNNVSKQMAGGKYRNENLEVAQLPKIGIGVPGTGVARKFASGVLSGSKAPLFVAGAAGAAGLVGAGAVGATLLPEIMNDYGNSRTANAEQNLGSNQNKELSVHGNSIPPTVNTVPSSQDQITFDQNGHVGVFNPFDGVNGVNKQQYQDKLAALNATVKTAKTAMGNDFGNPSQLQKDTAIHDNALTDIDTLNALNTKSRSLDTPNSSAVALQGMNNTAADDIRNGWSNISLANGSLDKLATLDNGKYSKLASALKKLQDVSGQQIFVPGMSLDVAEANLQQATKTALWNTYYNQFPSQGGYNQLPQITGGTQTAPTNQLPPITAPTGQNSGTGVPHSFSY
jgi:hypothetical protein